MVWIVSAVVSYLLGSFNTAILVSRLLRRDDIRAHGSGNAGATNMLRTYGRAASGLTVLGDFLKTLAAVLLTRWGFRSAGAEPPFDPAYYAGLFVLLGHVFPVWFGFRGGKGVLAAASVVLLADPAAAGLMLAAAVPVFLRWRTMSVVSLAAAGLLPVVTCALGRLRGEDPLPETLFALAYGALVVWSHRGNLRRLRSGTEKPIVPAGTGMAPDPDDPPGIERR